MTTGGSVGTAALVAWWRELWDGILKRSGLIQVEVVAQETWHRWVRITLLLHLFRFHGDVLGALGILGGLRCRRLPQQPVCNHVSFPLVVKTQFYRALLREPNHVFFSVHMSSPWPAGFLYTPERSHQSPQARKMYWSCTGSSKLCEDPDGHFITKVRFWILRFGHNLSLSTVPVYLTPQSHSK